MVDGSVLTQLRRASGHISNIQTRYCGQAEKYRGAITLHNLDSSMTVEVVNSVFMDSDT